MNKRINLLLLLLTIFIFQACDKDDPEPTTGVVHFIFNNEIDGQPIQFGAMNYSNEAGNLYSVTLLKYYISNITFIKSDGTEFKAPNYELVDESVLNSRTFSMNVPVGDYTKLRFFMGVDSLKNFSGAQAGELDPAFGMFWDWNTGYLYFKHEGEFVDSTGVVQPLVYHYGSIKALVTEELDMTLPVKGNNNFITVTFNLNKLYRSPNVVDFNGNNLQSGLPAWLNIMEPNFEGTFQITGIQ